jgi:hypothetical protein
MHYMKGGDEMKIINYQSKKDMCIFMEASAKLSYSGCDNDCPKCRVSDG